MEKFLSRVSIVLLMLVCAVWVGVSSREPAEAAPRTSLWPTRGDECTVYLTGEALRTSIPDKGARATSMSGTFESMDAEWIVLIGDGEARWIPRANVLWMQLPVAGE